MKKEEIFEYVQKQYGTIPEYLWSKLPDSAVLRHKNGKWYAVIMTVEKSKLGLEGNDLVDIMDVKCDPEMTSMIIQTYGFLPGYHMNKRHWITILLDGSFSEAKILDFLDMSYDLIDGAGRKEENVTYEATKATLKGKFNMEIPIGSRFNLNELNYVATAFIESADGYFYYQMECETEGTNGNKFLESLAPLSTLIRILLESLQSSLSQRRMRRIQRL